MKPIIYLLIALGCILQGLFIKVEHEEKYIPAVILKGLAAFMFVSIGYIAYTRVNNPFNKTFFIGLVFGMLGDILLNLRHVFKKQGQKI